MSDKVIFNDYDVTVEIFDSVIAKWVLTDYLETDSRSTAYLRNRDKIQPKLVAGKNVTIDPDTNEISADVRLDQMIQFVSTDERNELHLGTDHLLYVSFSGLLRDKGHVPTRSALPNVAAEDEFISYYIDDEQLYVFAHYDADLGTVWLPLSFYVDMNLYVSKEEQEVTLGNYTTKEDLAGHNADEEAHPAIRQEISVLRQHLEDKEHFRGYFATTAEIEALPNPEDGDFAYSAETGTKWLYTNGGWSNSGVVVPDQMVPPADTKPLMDGVGAVGTANKYARADHVHDSDTSRVPVARTVNGHELSEDVELNYDDVGAAKKIHTSALADDYGGADDINFGHVRVSDATDSTDGVGSHVAATPLAVKKAMDAIAAEAAARAQALTDATVARDLEADFATYDSTLVGGVSAKAVGNQQLLITFTPVEELTPETTPKVVFSGAKDSILPSLGVRFGQVWDKAKVEQVGFAVFSSDGGTISINAISKMFAGTVYTLFV